MTRQVDDSNLRLRAWVEGKPIDRYSTKHFYIAPHHDALVAAFLRMGGESAPWAIAIGHPDEKPKLYAVPEARDRDLVAAMVAEVAPVLLEHFAHPDNGRGQDGRTLRQLWVPNVTHLEMLHFIAYAYAFAKWGPTGRAKTLRAVGRLTGWLFREAQRPGQQTVLVATDVLRSLYTFPSDPVREAHLGYLLAWLEEKGSRRTRLREAEVAEQLGIATTLDPTLEREQLDPEVESWNKAKIARALVAARAARKIESVLKSELQRRFDLTVRALKYASVDRRPTNAGVNKLVAESLSEYRFQYERLERNENSPEDGPAFTPSPETDRYPAAAASRYFVAQASEEFRLGALIHSDETLQQEAILAGDAIRGKIVDVWDESTGSATKPIWRVKCQHEGVLRIKEGTDLCVGGLQSRTVEVRELDWTGPLELELLVEVKSLKTVPRGGATSTIRPAADKWHIGKTVTLLPIERAHLTRKKNSRVWNAAVPGSWLTHAKPAGINAHLPVEVAEDMNSIEPVRV